MTYLGVVILAKMFVKLTVRKVGLSKKLITLRNVKGKDILKRSRSMIMKAAKSSAILKLTG